jgi:hypothetical protein
LHKNQQNKTSGASSFFRTIHEYPIKQFENKKIRTADTASLNTPEIKDIFG